MFDPRSDRLIYGDLLAPPPGYTLDLAVCTTYSLDLETLIASLVALGLNEATDTELLKSPVNTLHAIDRVSRKVVVFCEAGQTRIPPVSSPLHLLLEKMIVPVALRAIDGKVNYPSFHPKTWTIRYVSTREKPLYRFIVMSRNLTFDRSWDMAVTLEGREEAGERRKVQPLLDFLNFLWEAINSKDPDARQKRDILTGLSSGLQNVRFSASESGHPFRDFDILPLGIGEGSYDMYGDELFNTRSGHGIHDIVVMSPFISKGIIRMLDSDAKLLTRSSRRILITRRSELEKLRGAVRNTDIYIMKDAVVDGENELPDESAQAAVCPQDIHAKTYLSVKYSNVRLMTGSMNASENGLGRNVEMMLRLYTTPGYLSRDSYLKDIMGDSPDDKGNPFTKVDPDSFPASEEKDEGRGEELALKRLCRLRISGAVVPAGERRYDITLSCPQGGIPEGVTISPMRARGVSRTLDRITAFTGLRLLELSEFYSVSIGSGEGRIERLLFIPTRGIPQEREKGIITDVINDRRKFAEYVAFVLGDSSEQVLTEMMSSGESGTSGDETRGAPPLTALYERMLRVACDEPERLRDIGRLVKLIDNEEIVTPEFRDMYRTFMSALRFKYD